MSHTRGMFAFAAGLGVVGALLLMPDRESRPDAPEQAQPRPAEPGERAEPAVGPAVRSELGQDDTRQRTTPAVADEPPPNVAVFAVTPAGAALQTALEETGRDLHWFGLFLFFVAFALQTFAVMLRWYVADRWPNSNMFEAVTTAAWFGGCLAVLLEILLRKSPMRGLFALGSGTASMFALMVVARSAVTTSPYGRPKEV